MKSNKRFFNAAIGFALAASLALPYAAGAQGATGTASRPDDASFCKRLAEMKTNVEKRLGDDAAKIEVKREGALVRLDDLKKGHEDKLKDLREKEDAKRGERVNELADEADTDAQRQALQKFQADVAAAVASRRTATDAANEAFQIGLKALIAERKAAIDAATSTFAADVRAALAKAKTDCASGVSPLKVRQTLLDALKTARDQFQAALKAAPKVGPQVQALIGTRRAAHQKAMDNFHAALDTAKAELKTAFGA